MARTERQSRPRERSAASTSWLATAVGLGLLVVAGFGVGMVAGVVWEDPGLVFAYVTGETEEVAWDEPAAAEPEVAAAPPPRPAAEPERVVDPQLRREAAKAPAVAPPKAAPAVAAAPVPAPRPVASAPAGNVAVQVGAFESSAAAERLKDSLTSKGFPVYVSPGTKSGGARWRVRVGPLATREEAEATAERLKKSEKLPTWILNEDAG